MRLSYRLGAAIAITATGIFAVAAPAVAGAPQRSTAVPGGTQVWLQRFGGAHLSATATSVAASPGKAVVYVTGITAKTQIGLRNEVTVAYNAATGKQLWLERFQGMGRHPRGSAGVPSITVSPDGATVYVAGDLARGGHNDYLVIAYNAATGAQRWVVTPLAFASIAHVDAVAVSPDSATVYITGTQDFFGGIASKSYDTIALNAATGATKWNTNTKFSPHVFHEVTSIAVSPDGSTVFIGGSSGTVAYNAATGAQLWLDAYKQAYRRDPVSLAVSPDSATVYVTSSGSAPGSGGQHYWTAALNATTGAQLWQATYRGAGTAENVAATAIALSPDGSQVYVTGAAVAGKFTTIDYNAATGTQAWLQQSPNVGGTVQTPAFLAVSPDGSEVAVTGASDQASGQFGYQTAVFDAATGAPRWSATYQGTGEASQPAGITFSQSGAQVTVTGTSGPPSGQSVFATVAYQG
jgi:WD40 repeat protein